VIALGILGYVLSEPKLVGRFSKFEGGATNNKGDSHLLLMRNECVINNICNEAYTNK